MFIVKKINLAMTKGFSLVEMLMALLVASLLLAALAPVMTRRINENMHITSDTTLKGEYDIEEIAFGDSRYCPDITYDASGNPLYCEGEYVVPEGITNITVTAIGAGGGGGTAPTAGYTEYTTPGNASFTVPAMVNKIEATLISGAGAGGAGGQVKKTQTFVTDGNGGMTASANDVITQSPTGTGTWTIPDAVKKENRSMVASACGGGGGGGSGAGNWWAPTVAFIVGSKGYGGGSGGYVLNKVLNTDTASSLTYYIGGGGGGGNSSNLKGFEGTVGLPYGGGSGSYQLESTKDGGIGSASTSCKGIPGDGGPAVLSAAGRGGTGMNDGKDTTNFYPSNKTGIGTCPYGSIVHTTGGNGGSIGGGGGAIQHWYSCYSGGGGGGGGASQILTGTGIHLNAPGGGGASSWERTVETFDTIEVKGFCLKGASAGGGGGGGTGGGNGGSMGSNNGKKGAGGADGVGVSGGVIANSIFGSEYCSGGNGAVIETGKEVADKGKSGAIRLTYLDYGPGGSGAGTANIVPVRPVNVTEKETLDITIGQGGTGHKAGKINTDGSITEPALSTGSRDGEGGSGKPSTLKRGSTTLLDTRGYNLLFYPPSGCPNGILGGSSTYYCGISAHIHTGVVANASIVTVNGFKGSYGKTAGNGTTVGSDITYANGTQGGDGGQSEIFGSTNHCTPGEGGTATNPEGGNATGYGGCGGGGGYGLHNGGNGAGGYARISWNMFWDAATKTYKYSEIGTGGGGASGNVITETVRVADAQVIKIRIGGGGVGAKVVNNVVIPATSGETTIFGDRNFVEIKAGGGGGGGSAGIAQNAIVNGIGGQPSTVCDVGATHHINNANRCKKGTSGKSSDDENKTIGGLGADFSLTVNNKTYRGLPGAGGVQSTELNNSKGKTPEDGNIASGGGGAAILIHNKVTDLSQAGNLAGGNGAPGRIILKLWK